MVFREKTVRDNEGKKALLKEHLMETVSSFVMKNSKTSLKNEKVAVNFFSFQTFCNSTAFGFAIDLKL